MRAADLSAEQTAHVRAALRFLHARAGSWVNVAKALGVSKPTAMRGATPLLAFRIAKLAGVGVDDVLRGNYPAAGACPHCGHVRNEAAE